MASSDKPLAAVTHPTLLDLPLDRIHVGPRHRQDMGDLRSLADSMGAIGLLQPIGVIADFALVFGARRLRAARMLGWTMIAARIVDLPSIVDGEYAENEVRKDFTPSERVAIANAVRAEMGSRQGQRTAQTKPVDHGPQVGPSDWLARRDRTLGDRAAGANLRLSKAGLRTLAANRCSCAVETQENNLRRTTLLFAQRPERRFRANALQLAQLRSTTIS